MILSVILIALLQTTPAPLSMQAPLYCYGYVTFDSTTGSPIYNWTECSVDWASTIYQALKRIEATITPPTLPPNPVPLPNPTIPPLGVSVGGNQTTLLANYVNLTGIITNGDSTLTTLWSKQSGPGNVSFGNPNQVNTNASFSQVGSYVLQLTVKTSTQTANATVTITVQ